MTHCQANPATPPISVPTRTRAWPTRRPARRALSMATALLLTLLAALVVTSPASNAVTPTCTPTSFNGQLYCPGTISGVTRTAYGVGSRVVLPGVSVTARTTNTVTVQAWESTPCPAGYFCGASMTLRTLTVTWKGNQRPAVSSAIDIYGSTTNASLTPSGYVTSTTGCYIDYC
jgi:hypothetical protein